MGRFSPRSIVRVLRACGGFGFGVVAYVYLSTPDVRPLAYTNPKTTAFMELRAREARGLGQRVRPIQRWVPYTRISQHLKRAVIVTEDGAFFEHDGIDLEEIKKSIHVSMERGKPFRGASTITQQLAKNLYLSPSRNPARKLRELLITRRLEVALPKARIFEIYLNVIEWGDQIWGAEAAARTYFGVSAAGLSREQAALLAGAIRNPHIYNPARPRRGLLNLQQRILARRCRLPRRPSRHSPFPTLLRPTRRRATNPPRPSLPRRRHFRRPSRPCLGETLQATTEKIVEWLSEVPDYSGRNR
jgi:monofunctional biosynthetic peptidoglycan transglycosylase